MISIPQKIIDNFTDIHFQIDICKEAYTNTILSGSSTYPTIVFYKNFDYPYLTVISPKGPSYEDTMSNVTTALHLYSPLKACGCYVVLDSFYTIDNQTHNAINIFLMSEINAFSIILPYVKVEEDNSIIWLDDKCFISSIDDQELDEIGKTIVSSFYLFVNSQNILFTVQEIMSYMSKVGHQILFHDSSDEIKYLKISDKVE